MYKLFQAKLFFSQTTLISLVNVLFLLASVLLLVLTPHLLSVSFTIVVFILFILTWFCLHTLGIIPGAGVIIRFILVAMAIAILVMNYGLHFSQQASMSFLSILICLKLFEIKNINDRRNIFLIIFLAYFVLMTYFLNSQDILLSLYIVFNIIILSLLLSAFNRIPQSPLAIIENLYLIGRIMLKAIPIAIILFLFFPRIPGPLWTLPETGRSASTGLSDKMFPGSVTNLADSNEIAFRVDFDGEPPTADKLYWRGPVLTKTDGFIWSQAAQKKLHKKLSDVISNSDGFVSYTVTLEPHQQKWLFSLEMPSKYQGDSINGAYLSTDLQLLNNNNIYQLTQYQVTSATQFSLKTINQHERQEALYFPDNSNPKTFALGQTWQQSYKNKTQIISTGLNYFRDQPFYYTKQPDVMIDNPADQFLFQTRRGFCEHYASSFVLLMRAAGIPARVVTGYQGIEKNDVGNYYIVRQSNAHAWAEVWLDKKGWIRVDPTSMIPPERIEADIFQTNLDRLSFSSLNIPDLAQLSAQQKTQLYNFYKKIQQSIDNVKFLWNNWILDYGQSKQNLLLQLLGFDVHWQSLIFLLIGSFISLLILYQVYNYFHQRKKIDPIVKNYARFISKLNRAGLSVSNNHGPEKIKQLAIQQFPKQQQAIALIINHYIQIRYAKHTDKSVILKFIAAVKNLQLT